MLLVCLVFNQLVTHAFETVLEPPVEHHRARHRIPESNLARASSWLLID
jgi:hypothetical protein